MLPGDDEEKLAVLRALLTQADEESWSRGAFWAEFEEIAGSLGDRAFEDDADPELRWRFYRLLVHASYAGFGGPGPVEPELD